MAEAPGGSENLLTGNPRYRKLQDLNEGTFGVVMLALDTYTNEQVKHVVPAPCQSREGPACIIGQHGSGLGGQCSARQGQRQGVPEHWDEHQTMHAW